MKKIKSLFKRNYDSDWLVYNEVVGGSEWVINGEGVATEKIDGTSCLVKDGALFKRYDRKLTKSARKRKNNNAAFTPTESDYKAMPEGWVAAEEAPNAHTGHWPGWLPVTDAPEDKYHVEAFSRENWPSSKNGTYELIGEKVQGNPYELDCAILVEHGALTVTVLDSPRTFDALKRYFKRHAIEGIVWHHPDGRMVKIKRKDFGFNWPPAKE